ncbi:MAG TPA: FAD binding domain-containing protein [Terriglobales bacterium]|nr:FAD binding domain-containing protein [Terriglobales bacterium]
MSLPEFKLLRPRTVAEAVDLLAQYAPDIQVIAGGTDLIPSMRQKLFAPRYVIDIRGIRELRGVRSAAIPAACAEGGRLRDSRQDAGVTGEGVEIGALTSLTEIEHSTFLRSQYPVLAEAAATVASPILRNMGTLGGNICLDTRCLWYNQSLTWRKGCGFCIKKDGNICHVAPGGDICWAAFSGDTPPALLCLDAEIEIAGPSGTRRLPLRDFYTGIGDSYRKLEKNELLTRIFLPQSSAGWHGVYRKLRIRGSIDYPLAGVAVTIRRTNGHVEDARVALTAVNAAPVLVKGVREALAGRAMDEAVAEHAAELAARTAKPLTTSALTPEYRREMIRVFAKRALMKAFNS